MFNYSKVEFPKEGQCSEYETPYCFAVALVLPANIISQMVDNPMGVTREQLALLQGGYVDTGNWNGAKFYRNPVAIISWSGDRWEIKLDNGVIVMRTEIGEPIDVASEQKWWARIVQYRDTVSSKTGWAPVSKPFGVKNATCPKGHAFPQYAKPKSRFPVNALYHRATRGKCQEKGYSKPVGYIDNEGTRVSFYKGKDKSAKKIVKNRNCPVLRPVQKCPKKPMSLPSCSGDTLVTGTQCVAKDNKCGTKIDLQNCNDFSVYDVISSGVPTSKNPCCRDKLVKGCTIGCAPAVLPTLGCGPKYLAFFILIFLLCILLSKQVTGKRNR